jgi:NADH:ubiquinone oxidoreductase subunit K
MVGELALLNFLFMVSILALLSRSWSYVGVILIIECLWVVLYALFITAAQYLDELSFFMVAFLILVLSAVELVIGLICFILYYNTFNLSSITPAQRKATKVFVKTTRNAQLSRAI